MFCSRSPPAIWFVLPHETEYNAIKKVVRKMSKQRKPGKIILLVLAAAALLALAAIGIFYLRISSPAALFESTPTAAPEPATARACAGANAGRGGDGCAHPCHHPGTNPDAHVGSGA